MNVGKFYESNYVLTKIITYIDEIIKRTNGSKYVYITSIY